MELTRRRVLAALAVGTTGAGAYYATSGGDVDGDDCAPRREAVWEVAGSDWTRPVRGPNGLLAAEGFASTGGSGLNRLGCFVGDRPQWVYQFGGDGVGVPHADEDLVAVGTGADRVYAFDQPTGHHRWTYDAGGREEYGGGSWGQPAHVDGAVVAAVSHSERTDPDPQNRDAYAHRLLALDDADGSVRWRAPVDAVAFRGPVVHSETVVVATDAGSVYGVALDGGEQRWRDSLTGTVWAPLCLADGTVYVAADEGDVAGFDAATGERAWTRTLDTGVADAALAGDRLVVGTRDERALALSTTDGETDWRVDLGAPAGALDATAEQVVILDDSGVVHVVAEEGGPLDAFRITDRGADRCGWRPAVGVARGLLVNRFEATVSTRGRVAAFDLGDD